MVDVPSRLAYHDGGLRRQRRRPAAAHPGRVPRAAAPLPRAADPGHGRVLRIGAHHARRSPRPLLRRGARARPPADGMVERAARRSPLRRLLGRRRRHHGGGQPGRAGRRRPDHRPQHRAAERAASQPVHLARPRVRVPLLLHAQALVLAPRARARRLSRRLRHARRAVRDADAHPDAQARARHPDRPLRLALLERGDRLRGDGPPRDDRARGSRPVLLRG